MEETVDITVIIPAYNEAHTIGRTITELKGYLARCGLSPQIIISAEGTDGTCELVAALASDDKQLHLLQSRERLGKGRAIRQAVALARGRAVALIDADGKIPIQELGNMLPWLDEGYDLVIGSRALEESQISRRQPWYRRMGSRCFGIIMHLLVGLREIPDTQCGFKLFRKNAALDLFGRQKIDGYMYDVEILSLAKKLGYRLRQVGITWEDDGDSRLQLVRDNFRSGIDLIRLRIRLWGHLSPSPIQPERETILKSETYQA